MKQIVLLEYSFMFDPSATWAHLFEFEKDLSKFFAGNGLEVQAIKSVDGSSGRRIMAITKAPSIGKPVAKAKSTLNKMRKTKPKKVKTRQETGFSKVKKAVPKRVFSKTTKEGKRKYVTSLKGWRKSG